MVSDNFLHDDHTGNDNYNDNCNYNYNKYDNDNNDLFDCNNDISNEVYFILCDGCFYFLNNIVGSTDKMSSMTYLYFTSKHTHPLRKTNNNPIYDCEKLYSNIQGDILLSQYKMLMTSKDLWINLLLSKLSLIKSNLIIYIKTCEDIISDIFSIHPHWSGKIHSHFRSTLSFS